MNDLIGVHFLWDYNTKKYRFIHMKFTQKIPLPNLKRRLAKLKLYRRKNKTSLEDLMPFFQNQLKRSGQMHEYRWFHLKCLQKNFIVPQQLLICMNPKGVGIWKTNV